MFSDIELEYQRRAIEAQRLAAHSFARLLNLAETSDTGQIKYVVRFIASVYDGCAGFPLKLDAFELRAVDVAISDDMLACLDALRWAKAPLHTLVPDGDQRVRAVLDQWGLKPPEDLSR